VNPFFDGEFYFTPTASASISDKLYPTGSQPAPFFQKAQVKPMCLLTDGRKGEKICAEFLDM
jgi:hypothetical protein